MRWLLAVWMLAVTTLVSIPALADYTPPPIAGYVTDAAGKLTPQQMSALEMKLAAYRQCSTNHVAVFYPRSLDGSSIEDAANTTFNAWHIGEAKKDNGVLLVLATSERKIRIEVGKGVEGSLTDLESSRILEDVVAPNIKADRFFEAADQATTRIGKALGGCPIADISTPGLVPVTTTMTPAKTTSKPNAPAQRPLLSPRATLGVITFMFVLMTFVGFRDTARGVFLGAMAGFVSWFVATACAEALHTVIVDYVQWVVTALSALAAAYVWWRRFIIARDPGAPPLVSPLPPVNSSSGGGGGYSSGAGGYGGGGGYSGGGGGGGGGYSGGGGSSGGGGASGGY